MALSFHNSVQMAKAALLAMVVVTRGLAHAEEFEVATITPTAPDWNAGRYMRMKSANQFEAKNYTLRVLLSAAYNLSAPGILGGPGWVDSDRYDILAENSGGRAADSRPADGDASETDRRPVRPHIPSRAARNFDLLIDRRQEWAEADQEQSSARYRCRTPSAAGIRYFTARGADARTRCKHGRVGHGASAIHRSSGCGSNRPRRTVRFRPRIPAR